ncbi:exonuclease domain-containing protein [Streptomyces sp. NBC_01498]|uniref:exonuclease domain-containing protein n=1 Tax=Streptomyces sp. NBC_01498 TaxID=2975870 RepID=UPI002E7B65E7|nr:exonuclease domain-containing protein [Streptomyces sp. NBC_01498]WTL27821.1 exonuclease domain-containing protein [Streptomyces sp. NBC_01498]
MTHWYEGPLAAFDIETTGIDAEEDRIVSAALVVQDVSGARARVTRWLVDPGIPIPVEASRAHGLTDALVQRTGRWPAPVIEEVGRGLAEQCLAGRPLVVMNAPFTLTLLDREMRRHRSSSLARYLEKAPFCVLDPGVLDRHLDPVRKGRRRLIDLCSLYGVVLDGSHDPVADAAAALEVVRSVGRAYATTTQQLTAAQLHARQAAWHAAQTRGRQERFARGGSAPSPGPVWPLRPHMPVVA